MSTAQNENQSPSKGTSTPYNMLALSPPLLCKKNGDSENESIPSPIELPAVKPESVPVNCRVMSSVEERRGSGVDIDQEPGSRSPPPPHAAAVTSVADTDGSVPATPRSRLIMGHSRAVSPSRIGTPHIGGFSRKAGRAMGERLRTLSRQGTGSGAFILASYYVVACKCC